MSEQTKQEMEVVERLEDIPAFATEDEEHRYWATHMLSKVLLNQMGPVEDGFLPPPRPRTKPVPIRLSDDIIQRESARGATAYRLPDPAHRVCHRAPIRRGETRGSTLGSGPMPRHCQCCPGSYNRQHSTPVRAHPRRPRAGREMPPRRQRRGARRLSQPQGAATARGHICAPSMWHRCGPSWQGIPG